MGLSTTAEGLQFDVPLSKLGHLMGNNGIGLEVTIKLPPSQTSVCFGFPRKTARNLKADHE